MTFSATVHEIALKIHESAHPDAVLDNMPDAYKLKLRHTARKLLGSFMIVPRNVVDSE